MSFRNTVGSLIALTVLAAASPAAHATYAEGWEDWHRLAQQPARTDKAVAAKTVRAIYFVPADRSPRNDYRQAIASAMLEMHAWFKGQLDGRTFALNDPIVEVCESAHDERHFASDTFNKVGDDLRACGFDWEYHDPDHAWVVYADVRHGCDLPGRLGVGAPGITMMPEQDLQGLAGRTDITDDCGNDLSRYGWDRGRWIGGLGHEFGHALGLPHPPGCDTGAAGCDSNALMWLGYSTWPNTYFRDDDRATLRAHPLLQGSPGLALSTTTVHQLEGTWFDPARGGEGLAVQVGRGDSGKPLVIPAFYSYDDDRRQAWITGSAELPTSADALTIAAIHTSGAAFGEDFVPGDVIAEPWGTLTLSLTACNLLRLDYRRDDDVDGSVELQRLLRYSRYGVCAPDD